MGSQDNSLPIESGNGGLPARGPGRPKGSKNKVTLFKLMAEEAVRTDNAEAMLDVCRKVIEQAMNGDRPSQALVWNAVMSRSGGPGDLANAKDRVEIHVKSDLPPEIKAVNVIDVTPEDNSNE